MKLQSISPIRACCLPWTLAICLASFSVLAIAADDPSYQFHLAAGSLDASLKEYARLTHQEIVYDKQVVAGKAAPEIDGQLSAADALQQLLQPAGLVAEKAPSGAIMVKRPFTSTATRAGAPAERTVAANDSGVGAQDPDAQGAGDGLAEIVVTAEHEQSSISRTPLAITALSGEDLRSLGINNTRQLTSLTPNLSIDQSYNMLITIRGITSTDSTEKGDPAAAFMLDGIYIARTQAQDVSFYDVNRVEVLRGPQGTLWGRNTTAGLVNVISNAPEHKDSSAVNLSYGNYNARQVDGFVNVDAGEYAAFRASVSYDERQSYFSESVASPYNTNPQRDNVSTRLQGLFNLAERTTLLVRLDYSSLDGSIYTLGNLLTKAYDLTNPLNPVRLPVSSSDLLVRDYAIPYSPRTDDSTWGATAELNSNLGPVLLTYLGSYRDLHLDERYPFQQGGGDVVDGFYYGNFWQNSQELRVASTSDGPLKAQGGLYFFKEESDLNNFNTNAYGLGSYGFVQGPTISQSYAAFGQATYSILPTVRLTGGLRFTKDEKSRDGATVYNFTSTSTAPPFDATLLNWASRSWSKTTWKAQIEADLWAGAMAYGGVSTGYKAGGFNDGCVAGTVDPRGAVCNYPNANLYYKPENLTAYEIGLKGTASGMFRYAVDAFYYNYSDMQVSSIGNVDGAPAGVTQNAGRSKVKGLEFEGTLKLSRNHRIDGSATWLDAKYSQFNPPTADLSGTVDWSGRRLDRSPTSTVSLNYVYTQPIASAGTLELQVGSRFSASYVVSDFAVPAQYEQPSSIKADASLRYSAASDKWYVRAYGHNLGNRVTLSGVDSFQNMYLSEPRTFGVGMGFKY